VSPISEVDLDRLADYTAGLLDRRERDRVDELIATDPAWRDAHVALLAAQPRLDAVLAGLGSDPLPVDVAVALDAALVREGEPAVAGTTVKARRRWRRLMVSTAGAAAAVVAVFGGVVALSNSGGPTSHTLNGGQGAAAPAARAPAEGFADAGPATVLHSGTDYTPRTLSALVGADRAKDAASGSAPRPAAPGAPGVAQAAPPDGGPLARLGQSQALGDCLAAIVALHGGTPSVVDYARFQGRPALIVVLTTGSAHRIVVAGPECGTAGPAEIYTTVS
jgi:hypothetical protein